MGPPYPGAFTEAPDGTTLTVTDARIFPRDGYYIGLPGQVQAIDGTTFIVSCGDGRCLEILEWSGATLPPAMHSKLGKSAL